MANHCDNYIVIGNCNAETIDKIKSIFEGIKNIKLEYSEIPFYNELMAVETHFDTGGLSHRFGTKWIDVNDISDNSDDEICVSCTTAWSPCLGLTEMIAKVFVGVTITHDYTESGCDFGGHCVITSETFEDDCLTYLAYLKKYDSEGFDNELVYLLENLYDNDKQAMISDESYSEYADDINEIEEVE